MKYYEDPILGKGRAADISGGTGGSGTEYIGGFAIGISGETISRLRYMPIESVTGSSVTLQAGHAYKAYATSTAITLNTETVPANEFGMEGHIEIYVAGTGYVVTGSNVVLANALEPDAVNNCTVRFHDGIAIIAVEDHVAGYIVVNGSTSGDGSLYYGISTSTNDYVAFDASLNGTTIPLAGAVAEGEKHIVGNGYAETTLTGAVDCGENKVTVANLSLQDVGITGGTMTLGDAYIPSGSTVAVRGGGLAVEKVTGAGSESVIDLGGTHIVYTWGTVNSALMSGVIISGGFADYGGALSILNSRTVTLSNCILTQNSAGATGNILVQSSGNLFMYDTIVSSNLTNNTMAGILVSSKGYCLASSCSFGNNFGDFMMQNGGSTLLKDCEVTSSIFTRSGGVLELSGSNHLYGSTYNNLIGQGGSVTLTSGAILDLTGNTNATPIAPGGGITFEDNVTVLYGSSGGAVSSAIISGGTVEASIGNAGNMVFTSSQRGIFGTITFDKWELNTQSTTINPSNLSVITLNNCSLIGTSNGMYLSASNKSVTVNLSGTFESSNPTVFRYNETSGNGAIDIADGTAITLTNTSPSTLLCDTIGTVTIGTGCTINGNDLTAGTYSNCTISADGTITEA